MKRKLVQHGPSLMISVPIKWVRSHSLTKGDFLEVKPRRGKLEIFPHVSEIEKSCTISIPVSRIEAVRAILVNLYRLGYTKINVNYEAEKTIQQIRDVLTKHCLGMQITNIESGRCDIELLFVKTTDNLHELQRKIFRNIDQLIEKGTQCFSHIDKEIQIHEDAIKSFDNVLRRLIHQRSDYPELEWSLMSWISTAQREVYFAIQLLPTVTKETRKIKYFLDHLRTVFDQLHQTKVRFTLQEVQKYHQLSRRLNEELKNELEATRNPLIISHFTMASRALHLASSPLFAMTGSTSDSESI